MCVCVCSYSVNDVKDGGSCSKSSGKCLQLRQSVAERECSDHYCEENLRSYWNKG